MTDLSPAAQAVLDAWDAKLKCLTRDPEREALAAALGALADQVVPLPIRYPCNRWIDGYLAVRRNVRAQILAIATELKNRQ